MQILIGYIIILLFQSLSKRIKLVEIIRPRVGTQRLKTPI